MNELIIGVVRVDAELRAARPQVPFLKEIDTSIIVDEDPHPNVKLTLVYKQGLLNVLLYDEAVMLELVRAVLCSSLFRGILDRWLLHL